MKSEAETRLRVSVETSAKGVHRRLIKLLETCSRFSWASAWVTDNEVVRAALKAKRKMAHFVVGTHYYITDPKILERCLGLKSVKIKPPEGKLFHPKVYAFILGDRLEVYVGSSNLTFKGLSANMECGVFLNAKYDHPQVQQLLNYVEECWNHADELDEDFVESYRANNRKAEDAWIDLEHFEPIKPSRHARRSTNTVAAQTMGWSKFVQHVRREKDEKGGRLERRLRMLSAIRLLASQRFDRLSEEDRRRFCGLVRGDESEGIGFGWFGQMSARGSYNNVVREHYRTISDALEHIPAAGPVKKQHYDGYLKAFMLIEGATKNWIGMGTRLLAMRRPDQFVCIDGPNKKGVCGNLGAPYTRTNLENYWEYIIEQIRLAPWYQHEVPKTKLERQIWECRTALLDAIYYDDKY